MYLVMVLKREEGYKKGYGANKDRKEQGGKETGGGVYYESLHRLYRPMAFMCRFS